MPEQCRRCRRLTRVSRLHLRACCPPVGLTRLVLPRFPLRSTSAPPLRPGAGPSIAFHTGRLHTEPSSVGDWELLRARQASASQTDIGIGVGTGSGVTQALPWVWCCLHFQRELLRSALRPPHVLLLPAANPHFPQPGDPQLSSASFCLLTGPVPLTSASLVLSWR